MNWYEPDDYGGIPNLNSVRILGFASDPSGTLIGMEMYGASSAVRSIMGRIAKGESISFDPKKSWRSLYASTTGRDSNQSLRWIRKPKSPTVYPDGNIGQMVFRKEDPKNLNYLCYPEDDKADTRFLEMLKLVTDYPIHPSWVPWLKEKAYELTYWGVCNAPQKRSYGAPNFEEIEPSEYGMQFRWIRNTQTQWEELIANNGLKFGHLKLPEVVDG